MRAIFAILSVLNAAGCNASSTARSDDLGDSCTVVGSWSYVSDLNFNYDDGINLASDGNFTVWQGQHEGTSGTWSIAGHTLTLRPVTAKNGAYALNFSEDCAAFQASSATDCSALAPLFVCGVTFVKSSSCVGPCAN